MLADVRFPRSEIIIPAVRIDELFSRAQVAAPERLKEFLCKQFRTPTKPRTVMAQRYSPTHPVRKDEVHNFAQSMGARVGDLFELLAWCRDLKEVDELPDTVALGTKWQDRDPQEWIGCVCHLEMPRGFTGDRADRIWMPQNGFLLIFDQPSA